MKKLLFSLIIFFPMLAMSQGLFEFGGGIGNNTPKFKIEMGYQSQSKIVSEISFMAPITRKYNDPLYAGLKLGYNFNGFVPAVGCFYRYANSDDKVQNYFAGFGYSLKYILPVGPNGGIYGDAQYLDKNFQFTVGFHANIF